MQYSGQRNICYIEFPIVYFVLNYSSTAALLVANGKEHQLWYWKLRQNVKFYKVHTFPLKLVNNGLAIDYAMFKDINWTHDKMWTTNLLKNNGNLKLVR